MNNPKDSQMITVHNLENSQSIRILWLLEELGIDYAIQQYSRNKGTSFAPEAYRNIHPVGWAPVITDGEDAIAETNAIVDHILDKYSDSPLRPAAGSAERIQYLYWFHASQGTLMPFLVTNLVLKRMVSNMPFFLRPIIKLVTGKVRETFVYPRTSKLLGYMDTQLSQTQWLAGKSFTAADIVTVYCLEGVVAGSLGEQNYPNITRYMKDIRSRKAYQIAMEKNGPFNPIVA